MIGKVGDDMFGRLLIKTLQDLESKRGIGDGRKTVHHPAFVSLKSGKRDFSFARKPGADTRLTPDESTKA